MNMSVRIPPHKVKIRIAFYMLVYLTFIKPGICDDFAVLDLIFNLGRFGFSLWFTFLAVINRKINHIIYPLAIFVVIMIPTLYNHGLANRVLACWIPGIGILAFFELNKKNALDVVKVFYSLGRLLLLTNLISMLIFPDGIVFRAEDYVKVWLLGQKQDFIVCVLSTLLFGLIMLNHSRNNIFVLVRTCIYIFGMLIIAKPMGLILILLIVALMLRFESWIKKTNFMITTAIMAAAELVCIFLAFIYSYLLGLSAFLGTLGTSSGLSKAQTMAVRFELWKGACNIFMNHKGIGIGVPTETNWYLESGTYVYHTIMHNIPLDIAYAGGGLALLIYIFWNIKILKKLNLFKKNRMAYYVFVVYFAFCIICLTECPYQPMNFIILGIALNCEFLFSRDSNTKFAMDCDFSCTTVRQLT